MATHIYLGMPPANVVKWIEENVKTGPVFKDETQVVYIDGTTWEGLIEGTLTSGSIPNIGNVKDIAIGNKVTTISNGLFYNCRRLISLSNSTVTQVEQWFNNGIFGTGMRLESEKADYRVIKCYDGIIAADGKIEYNPDTWGYDGIGWNITYIDDSKTVVFHNDGTVWMDDVVGGLLLRDLDNQWWIATDVRIGNTVTKINDDGFHAIETLRNVYIPDSVTSIGDAAFYFCTSLTTLFIPDDIVVDGNYVFQQCESLASLPNSTTAQVEQWFKDGAFHDGGNYDSGKGLVLNIQCKDGTIHAVGKWNASEFSGEGWDITITPL